jgi:REP element-mobilizing transposase RayT
MNAGWGAARGVCGMGDKRWVRRNPPCYYCLGEERSESRLKKGEAAIWQRRYWEHMIRDEQDLRRHEDYIQQISSGGCNPADFIRTIR